ncbi:hypothetical protein WAI453_012745 [Rhynchosporium graminicola]
MVLALTSVLEFCCLHLLARLCNDASSASSPFPGIEGASQGPPKRHDIGLPPDCEVNMGQSHSC